MVPEFRQIRKNFVLSVYSSQEAIDTDDGSAYYNTTENFFARSPRLVFRPGGVVFTRRPRRTARPASSRTSAATTTTMNETSTRDAGAAKRRFFMGRDRVL